LDLPNTRLRNHCLTVVAAIGDYKSEWRISEQLIPDSYPCGLSGFGSVPLVRSPRFPHVIPLNIYSTSPLGKCRLVLNGFSSDNPGVDSREFIEITRVCEYGGRQLDLALTGWYVYIISGVHPEIEFVTDLRKTRLVKRGCECFVVIGDDLVDNVDLQFSSPEAQFKPGGQDGRIPNGDQFPFAIILLYSHPT